MIVLDLFCGTKSIGNAFERHGHKVFTVDWNKEFEPTLCADIGKLTALDLVSLCGGGASRCDMGISRLHDFLRSGHKQTQNGDRWSSHPDERIRKGMRPNRHASRRTHPGIIPEILVHRESPGRDEEGGVYARP